MGWTSPLVLTGLFGGVALLVAFCFIELRVEQPMFDLHLLRIRAVRLRAAWPPCSPRSPAAACSSC